MWKEIKEVWHKQWLVIKDAWKCAWDGAVDAICDAIYSIANFIWGVLQTVIFLPLKTAIYETGKILIKHLIDWIKKI